MALDTVQDYVTSARILLLDQAGTGQYRYLDSDLVSALNFGLLEARRLRPDLMKAYFNGTAIPTYSSSAMSTAVDMEPMYRMAFVYYMVGWSQLRDDENDQDARAAMFMNKFTQELVAPNG